MELVDLISPLILTFLALAEGYNPMPTENNPVEGTFDPNLT